MLVLSRRAGQTIKIGDSIEITVLRAKGRVTVGVTAPADVPVNRTEVVERIARGEPQRRKPL